MTSLDENIQLQDREIDQKLNDNASLDSSNQLNDDLTSKKVLKSSMLIEPEVSIATASF